ncbi:hypothetical protein ADUPG1_003200, partial [Aduncisulcus paluster]
MPGRKPSLTAAEPTLASLSLLMPRPARSKITIRASLRRSPATSII